LFSLEIKLKELPIKNLKIAVPKDQQGLSDKK
jgi:hypothetical protein